MNSIQRIKQLREIMENKNIDICVLLEPDNQYYLSSFKAITYSRPIVLVVTKEQTHLIIPGLEEIHAQADAKVDSIHVYYEHPEQAGKGISHFDHLNPLLALCQPGSRMGIEFSIMSVGIFKSLQAMGFEIVDVGQDIMEMRYIKDADEIELLIEAGRLSDIGLKHSLENARPGISELEFDSYGDRALLEEVSKRFPDTYIGFEDWTNSGIDRTAMPHLYSNTRILQDGDVVIHSRQVWFKGYRAENERTFFIGKATEKQKDVFKVAVEGQRAGLDIIRPGITAKEVDLAARKVFKKAGYEDYANHRIGHGLGLSEHEEPYLRFDSDLVLQEGMVFSMEPGLYLPGVGGFRHSDTVILTKNGSRLITQYPRELKDLMF